MNSKLGWWDAAQGLARVKRARLSVLIAVGAGALFTAGLLMAMMWAYWQASLDAPWSGPGWLLVWLVPTVAFTVWGVVRGARVLILDPLDSIRRMALRIADGDGLAVEESPDQMGLELRELAQALNVMSSSLRQEHELLELRVAERTARLDALNAELRAEVEGRRRIEQSLRDSELRYRGLFDHSIGGIVLLRLVRDKQGQPVDFVFTDLNPAAEALMGQRAAATAGRSVGEFYPAIDKRFREIVARVALGGKPVQMETFVPPAQRYVALSIFALQPDQVAIEFEDITEVKVAQRKLAAYSERLAAMVEARTRELQDAQEQLLRREKLAFLGQMAGSVGHELRNPLAVIANAATLLSYMLPDADPMVQEYIDQISSQVTKSDKIIRDLLNLARTGRAIRVQAPASALVAQVLAQAQIPQSVAVQVDVPETLPLLLIDPQQIELVLNNLVINAGEAMPDGGTLTIRAWQEGARVAVAIADTGCGIPPENRAKLFEPLFTTKRRGIGLGLAVSQNLAQVNEGLIEVESQVGQGSTFTVRLPIATPESLGA